MTASESKFHDSMKTDLVDHFLDMLCWSDQLKIASFQLVFIIEETNFFRRNFSVHSEN